MLVLSPQVQPSEREKRGREPPPPLNVDILRDRGNTVARRYGLTYSLPPELQDVYRRFGIDLPVVNGDGEWTLAMPARIVIDRNGIIRRVGPRLPAAARRYPESAPGTPSDFR